MSDEAKLSFSPPSAAEYFHLLLENVTDYAIFCLDPEGRVATWNTGAERILGYAEAEILQQSADILYTSEDRAAGLPEQERATARAEGRANDERRHVKKDGSSFWACGILTALYNEQGELRGYVKILRDFTDRKRQEKMLQEREADSAHKARLLDLVSDSIFAHDLDNRITYWNQAAETMYGYVHEEAHGRIANELLHTEFPVSFAAIREQLLTNAQWEGELVHTRKDGSKLIVASRWAVERNEQAEPVAYLESNRDITELKQAQEALQREQAHIEALNQRLQWAMTETHHRTKNNLQLLSAMMDMMKSERTTDGEDEGIARLLAFVRSMAAIHDILTNEARNYGQVQDVSSKEFLERLVSLLAETAGTRRRVQAEIQPTRLSTKQATSIALIVNELVANALKHSSGDVEVAFYVQAGTGHLRVCDNGPGFAPEFNLSVSANTGLELVEMLTKTDLGGQALYTNLPEGGACVTITIPLS